MMPANAAFMAAVSNAVDGTLYWYLIENDSLILFCKVNAGDKIMPMALSPSQDALTAHTRGRQKALIYYPNYSVTEKTELAVHTPIADDLVYIAISPNNRFMYGVSYETNQLIVYDMPALQRGECKIVAVASDIPHAHCVAMSPDGQFVYVSSLSSGRIMIFRWHQNSLILLDSVLIDAGFGPRHLRLHSPSSTLYAVSEFQGRVAAFYVNQRTGLLTLDTLTERPAALAHLQAGFARPGAAAPVQPAPAQLANLCWAAEIQISPDARFIYTTERTSGRIFLWRRNTDGQLISPFWIETEAQPRSIQLTPDGRYLLSCGEKSPMISLYRINQENGVLDLVARCPGGQGANCIEIVSAQSALFTNTGIAN